MIEQYEAALPDIPEETLLERLKRQKLEADNHSHSGAGLDQQADVESLETDEFKRLSSLAMHEAKTIASTDMDWNKYELLSSLTVIPDGQLANAHNNEFNF